jgi:hypothetical protein
MRLPVAAAHGVDVIPPGVAAPLTPTRSAPTAVEQRAPVAGSHYDLVDVDVDVDSQGGELLTAAASSGFIESLAATRDAYVVCHCCGQRCHPDELLVQHVHGEAMDGVDPQLVVAWVICPTCTAAGTLVLVAGVGAAHGHAEVFRSMMAGRDPLAMT